MAKGQLRSNREKKKPKQEKPKKNATAQSQVTTTFQKKPAGNPSKAGK